MRSKPAYNSYDNVKKRCDVPTHDAYPNYGGKGITYDKTVFRTYKTFWDTFGHLYEEGLRKYPGEKLTIDRIENDGDYVVGNIRFVPSYINCNNKSDNYMIEWRGVNQSAAMWAREFGITAAMVIKRHKAGWSMHLISVIPNSAPMARAITKQIKLIKEQTTRELLESNNDIEK